MQTVLPKCPKCNRTYNYRVPRAAWLKALFPFLPLRRYFCNTCFTKRYEWHKEAAATTATAA